MARPISLKRPTLPLQLAVLAATQVNVLSVEQVVAVVSSNTLSNLVRHGVLIRLWRGAFALPGWQDNLDSRLRAAELTVGRPIVPCLHTAAAIGGFDIVGDPAVHILADEPWGTRLGGLVLHRRLITAPLVEIGGRLVTNPYETALCVAALQSSNPRMLAVLDAALRSGHVSDLELLATCADRLSVNRIRQVRPMISWADPRAESPPESWLRWVFLDAGLPPPTPQVWIDTPSGRRRRVDLGWPKYRVGCEYEGVEFHTGAALHKDRQKLNDVTAADWLTFYVTQQMVWHDRARLVGRVDSMLRARGWRPGADVR